MSGAFIHKHVLLVWYHSLHKTALNIEDLVNVIDKKYHGSIYISIIYITPIPFHYIKKPNDLMAE